MTTSAYAFEDSTGHLLAECRRMAYVLTAYQPNYYNGGDPATLGDHTLVGSTAGGKPTLGIPPSAAEQARADAQHIDRTARNRADQDTPLRLHHLSEAFDLERHHTDILVLAMLPVVYPQFESVFAELQNDLAATQPTVGLVADLYSTGPEEFVAATGLMDADSPVRKHDLIQLGHPKDTRVNRISMPIFVEDRIESYLLDHPGIDPVLEPYVDIVSATTGLDALRLDSHVHDQIRSLAARAPGGRFYWYGPTGTEKRRAVETVVPGKRFVRVDLPGILKDGMLDRLLREAVLMDLPVHLESVSLATSDGEGPVTIDDILDRFRAFDRLLIMTGTDEWTPRHSDSSGIDAMVEFPRPGFAVRRSFWEDQSDELPDELDPLVLAGTFELTQAEHEAALVTARSLAGGDTLTASDVYDGCSAQSAGGLAKLAEELEPTASWDDIVLQPETMRGLQTVAAHVRYKGRIYHEWAFSERFSRGTGIVALFSGPSGTGKTMAAEIIADDVGMRLFKIDLSSVVSKYIGETEKNLEQIFTEAEHSNAILLFDEADAVFGDRAAVSDATDRYANIEVNYLLQRIESYDGVVLLTTNFESNIDSAFMRRIDHNVEFRRPREPLRREIWEHIFPVETPVEDIDYEFLAGFGLTGGDIRTIAQTAAILGADDEGTITMKHVIRGLQRELQKSGTMVDPQEFEMYREYLYRE